MTPGDTPANTSPKPHSRLDFLDGWRALAVLIVIMSHVNGFRHDPAFLKAIARWAPAGQVGVLIFFFISGLVITRSARAEIATTADFSLPAFYIRRAFRIIPPLALYLCTCLVLGGFGLVDFHINNALPAFLYVCNVDIFNSCIWLGGHTWSLAFEEQFYMLFPIVLAFVALGRRPFIPHLIFAVAFVLLPLIWPLSYSSRLNFVMVYGLFGAGVLAAWYWEKIISFVERFATAGVLLMAVLVFVVTPITLAYYPLSDYYPLSMIVTLPLLVLFSGSARWLLPVLANPVLRYLGRISYGVYLWQELADSDLFIRQSLAAELAAVVGVFILCAILFEGMERPLIRLGARLANEAKGRRPAFTPRRRTAP